MLEEINLIRIENIYNSAVDEKNHLYLSLAILLKRKSNLYSNILNFVQKQFFKLLICSLPKVTTMNGFTHILKVSL